MPRHAQIHLVSLKSSLVNLPISLYGPLLERNIRPQHVAVVLSKVGQQPRQDIYVGWTGMLATSSVARFAGGTGGGDRQGAETVEMDPQFAAGLGYAAGDVVEIGLTYDLPHAKIVGTEPLTPDDWEIIELHSEHVENTLLSQVRVAANGQEIDVWVHGQTRVRLRVMTLDPSAKALLLTTDTEVSIAPKTRKSLARRSIPIPGSAESPATSSSGSVPQASTLIKTFSTILRVLPVSLVDGLPEAGEEPLICVPWHMLLRAAHVKSLPSGSPSSYSARVVLLKAPSNPVDSAEDGQVATQSPVAEQKVLDLSKPLVSPGAETVREKDDAQMREVKVLGLTTVPEGHAVIVGGSGSGPGGAKDWERVCLIVSLASTPSHDLKPESSILIKRSTRAPVHSLAGIDHTLRACSDFCRAAFIMHKHNFGQGVQGLLITGRTGSGKTEVSKAIARGLQMDSDIFAFSRYVDVARHKDKPMRVLRELFAYWRDKAVWHRPSVLVLDNLDTIAAAEVEHADSFRNRHLAESLISTFSQAPGIVIIASAQNQAALHPALIAAHLFKKVVTLRTPDREARKQILDQNLQARIQKAEGLDFDPVQPPNIAALAAETEGYSAIDLQDFVARAVHQAAIRTAMNLEEYSTTTLSMEDFKKAKEGFVPLSLRDIPLQTSTVAWSDIGGLSETRRVLRETLEWPTKYAPIFKQSPLRLRSGLLLYGFPGCGKTLLASAVARECGLNFISVKGPELLNKYIGASEKSVRDIFERASAAKPCVLFFDEFDSIAPKRGHDSTGVTDRVVNQLLTLMDGAEGLDGVYVLAATSRPDLIDSALLRPGRLDKALLCNMPTLSERSEILATHARKLPISPTVDFDALAARTDGFTGADLQALVYNAHLDLVHSDMQVHASLAGESKGTEREEKVEFVAFGGEGTETAIQSRAEEVALQRRIRQLMAVSVGSTPRAGAKAAEARDPAPQREIGDVHFEHALASTRPSVSADEIVRLSKIYAAFVSDRSGELPVPPDANGVGKRATLM